MFKRIVILSLLACTMAGCIKEDQSDCEPKLRFQFSYTYNNQRQDQLAVQVQDIRIYLFDQTTNKLANIIRVDQADIVLGWIEPDIPAGVYTAVAWAGSGTDLLQGGYVAAEMSNAGTHTYIPQARVGVTTLDNFRMMLGSEPLPNGSIGQVTPQTAQFDHLFFAMASGIEVAMGTSRTVDFDFLKNTSTLKVHITGLEYLPPFTPGTGAAPLNVFAVGKNERYGWNNAICGNARQMRYEPPYKTLTATAMDVDIKVQRLDIAYLASNPVLLFLQSPATGQDMILPLDVIGTIRQARNAQGNLLWQTQEEIDCEDEFPIEISILHDLRIKVTVNGFEIADTTPDIGRN